MHAMRIEGEPLTAMSGGLSVRGRGRGGAPLALLAALLLIAGCEVTRLPDSAAEPDSTGPAINPPTDGGDSSTDGGDSDTDGDDSSQPSPFTFSLPSGPSGPVENGQELVYRDMMTAGCDAAGDRLDALTRDGSGLSDDHERLWRAAIAACRGDEAATRQHFDSIRDTDFGDEDRDACVVQAAIKSALDRVPLDVSRCPPPQDLRQSPTSTNPPASTISPDGSEELGTDVHTETTGPDELDE